MMSLRGRKVLRDLWSQKVRTILVVLSIAIGVFAVGMIANTQAILSRELAEDYWASNPYHAIIYMQDFDERVVRSSRRGQGQTQLDPRFRVGGCQVARAVQLFDGLVGETHPAQHPAEVVARLRELGPLFDNEPVLLGGLLVAIALDQ